MPLFSPLLFPSALSVLVCTFAGNFPAVPGFKVMRINNKRARRRGEEGLSAGLPARPASLSAEVLANLWKEDKFHRDRFDKV